MYCLQFGLIMLRTENKLINGLCSYYAKICVILFFANANFLLRYYVLKFLREIDFDIIRGPREKLRDFHTDTVITEMSHWFSKKNSVKSINEKLPKSIECTVCGKVVKNTIIVFTENINIFSVKSTFLSTRIYFSCFL